MLTNLKTRTIGIQVAAITALVVFMPTAEALAGRRIP